jgi:hypothetical protein
MENSIRGMPEPHVGMDCTEVMYSDRNPYMIVRLGRNKAGDIVKFWMRPKAVKPRGPEYGEVGNVIHESGEVEVERRRRKDRKTGQWLYYWTRGGTHVVLGYADYHYDMSF